MSLIVPTDRLRRGDTLQTTGAPATIEAIENEHGDTLRLYVRSTTDFERFEIITTADERHTVTARALLTQAQALEIAEGWASMTDASDPGRWLYSFTSTEGIENEEHRTEMLAYVDGILAGSLDQQDDSVLERADLEALRAYLAEAPTRQRFTELDAFTTSYITAALWATNDEATEAGGEPLDRNYAPADIHPDTLIDIVNDCKAFQAENDADLTKAAANDFERSAAGHDYFLTRNGHGAGFWDRGLGALGDRLTKAAKAQGEVTFYVGDDNRIHADA